MIKISCLMAINRYDEFVPLAITSILNQTYEKFEFIILVNGDEKICKQRENNFNDSRIKILYSPIQQLSYNLNKGLEVAVGEYIARMDGDDVSLKERFFEQVEILDKNPETIVVSSLSNFIDSSGAITKPAETIQNPIINISRSLCYKNPIVHPSVMFRKKSIVDIGGYSDYICQDYGLWLRLLRKFKEPFYIINKPLLNYRIHPNQMRAKKEAYSMSAGLTFREFVQRGKILFLMGAILYYFKSKVLAKKN